MHKIDDNLLVTPALQDRLKDEALAATGDHESPWWCCVQRSNGQVVSFPYGYTADFAEKVVAHDLIKKANQAIHHDGCWLAQWLLDGRQLNVIWIDGDGDPQFTVEIDEDAPGVAQEPLTKWLDDMEQAWATWHHHMHKALAPTPEQLFKKAQGQQSPSQRSGKIILPDHLDPDTKLTL